jgi:hypothetical protein
MGKPYTIAYPLGPQQTANLDALLDQLWTRSGLPSDADRGALLYRGPEGWVVLAPPSASPRYLQGGETPQWALVDLPTGTTGSLPASRVSGLSGLSGVGLRARWEFGAIAGTAFTAFVQPYLGALQVNNATTVDPVPQGVFARLPTAASVGSAARLTLGSPQPQRRHLPDLRVILLTGPDVTSQRIWVGLSAGDFSNADTITNAIAWRYSTVAGDAGWRPITADGAAQTVGTAMGTIAATTVYQLDFRVTATGVAFSVDGGAEQTLTTNLVTDTVNLGFRLAIFTQVAASRQVGFGRAVCRYGATAVG